MNKRNLISLVATILMPMFLFGQVVTEEKVETSIGGVVSDESGNPLAGANVVVEGTDLGAASLEDGTSTIGLGVGVNEVAKDFYNNGPSSEGLNKFFNNDFQRSLDSIKDLFGQVPTETNVQQAEIQTPPLPNTPMPVVRTAQAVNPNTNLTRTQEALLSPEEKIIASRRV